MPREEERAVPEAQREHGGNRNSVAGAPGKGCGTAVAVKINVSNGRGEGSMAESAGQRIVSTLARLERGCGVNSMSGDISGDIGSIYSRFLSAERRGLAISSFISCGVRVGTFGRIFKGVVVRGVAGAVVRSCFGSLSPRRCGPAALGAGGTVLSVFFERTGGTKCVGRGMVRATDVPVGHILPGTSAVVLPAPRRFREVLRRTRGCTR